MKRLVIKCLFLMLIMIIFSSCEDKIIVSYYETGEKYEEYQYMADSIKHGIYRKYSQDGILVESANYVNGNLEGERIIYTYKSGVKEVSEIFKNDILDGRCMVFHPNGEMQTFSVYNANVLSGTVRFFDTSGVLTKEYQYVDNYEVIPFQEFHENGKIKWEGTQIYDHFFGAKKDFGLLKEYNEDGNLIQKIMFDEG